MYVVGVGGLLVPKKMIGKKARRRRIGGHGIRLPWRSWTWGLRSCGTGRSHQSNPTFRKGFFQRGEGDILIMGPGIRLSVTLRGIVIPAAIDITYKGAVGDTLIHVRSSNKNFGSSPVLLSIFNTQQGSGIPSEDPIHFFLGESGSGGGFLRQLLEQLNQGFCRDNGRGHRVIRSKEHLGWTCIIENIPKLPAKQIKMGKGIMIPP